MRGTSNLWTVTAGKGQTLACFVFFGRNEVKGSVGEIRWEGPSKESVEQFLKNFTFDKGKITTLDVDSIYRTIYQIDPDFKVLTFEEQIRWELWYKDVKMLL